MTTPSLPNRGDVETVVKNASTYARDLIERIVATFLVAFLGVAVAAGPGDMFSATFWETAAAAGLAAVGSLLKGLIGRAVGPKNSASTAPGV